MYEIRHQWVYPLAVMYEREVFQEHAVECTCARKGRTCTSKQVRVSLCSLLIWDPTSSKIEIEKRLLEHNMQQLWRMHSITVAAFD